MARVLVTGGCGFIGRHVAEELLAHGHEVRLLDAMIDQVHGAGAAPLPEGAELVRGDVRDADRVAEAIRGCEGVIHLAAEVGVGQSMYEIARYVGANDLGTAVLLEAILGHPVRRLVVASSMSVYGEGFYETAGGERVEAARRGPGRPARGRLGPPRPRRRAPAPRPHRRAQATRPRLDLRADQVRAGARGDDLRRGLRGRRRGAPPLQRLRRGPGPVNPYTGVLANFASRLAAGNRPTIFEDGEQKRDFVHVRDVARAFRLAYERPDARGELFNIGSGQAYTIAEVASLLAGAMGLPHLGPEILGKSRAGDIRNCFADISKAQQLLGFEPRHKLEDSLGEFVAWVAGEAVVDRNAEMRRELEEKGLVS
jgi:dTDP-L-rhamnose 4-epimerase